MDDPTVLHLTSAAASAPRWTEKHWGDSATGKPSHDGPWRGPRAVLGARQCARDPLDCDSAGSIVESMKDNDQRNAARIAWETRRAKYGPTESRRREGQTPMRRQLAELLARRLARMRTELGITACDVERLRRRCDQLEAERAQLITGLAGVAGLVALVGPRGQKREDAGEDGETV